MGSELWLDIRGPKSHLVRAALDPLGVAQLTDDPTPHAPATQRTVPDVTAHPLVQAEVYLPSAYTGVVVAARDTPSGITLCHVRHADGMIEQSLAHRRRASSRATSQALSLRATNDRSGVRVPYDQQGGSFAACVLAATRRALPAEARLPIRADRCTPTPDASPGRPFPL